MSDYGIIENKDMRHETDSLHLDFKNKAKWSDQAATILVATKLSKEMLDSTTLNIKSTPWWYTSDEYLYSKKSVYKLVDKLSGRSKKN